MICTYNWNLQFKAEETSKLIGFALSFPVIYTFVALVFQRLIHFGLNIQKKQKDLESQSDLYSFHMTIKDHLIQFGVFFKFIIHGMPIFTYSVNTKSKMIFGLMEILEFIDYEKVNHSLIILDSVFTEYRHSRDYNFEK